MMKDTIVMRGAAAALLLASAAVFGAADAQVVMSRPTSDSGQVHLIVTGRGRIPADSITVLVRAFEQEPLGSQGMIVLREKIDQVMRELAGRDLSGKMLFGGEEFPMAAAKAALIQKGWIGINAPLVGTQYYTPTGFYVDYFDYQPIVSVDPDSPAQKAGILPGDVLVAYNGVDLRGHRFNLTQMLAPDQKVVVTVKRDGETKEFPLVVAKAPQQIFIRRRDLDAAAARGLPPNVFQFNDGSRMVPFGGTLIVTPNSRDGNVTFRMTQSPDGVFGARVISLSPELSRVLKLESGLLIDQVPEETPAFKSGLRVGDVIVSAAGQPVGSLRKLLELLMLHDADRSANLVVVRDNKKRNVTVSW